MIYPGAGDASSLTCLPPNNVPLYLLIPYRPFDMAMLPIVYRHAFDPWAPFIAKTCVVINRVSFLDASASYHLTLTSRYCPPFSSSQPFVFCSALSSFFAQDLLADGPYRFLSLYLFFDCLDLIRRLSFFYHIACAHRCLLLLLDCLRQLTYRYLLALQRTSQALSSLLCT